MRLAWAVSLAAAAGFAAGFTLGRTGGQPERQTPSVAAAPPPAMPRDIGPAAAPPKPPPAASKQRNAPANDPSPEPRPKDPVEKLAAELATLSGSPAEASRMRSIIEDLAQRDPALALRTIADLPNRRLREEALSRLVHGSKPDALAEAARSLPAGAFRETALRRAAARAAESNPQLAVALADEMVPGSQRNMALLDLGLAWGRTDPGAAANFCLNHPDAWQREHTLMHLISHWGTRDAAAMQAWATANLQGPHGEKIAERALGALAESNFSAARAFYQGLAPEARNALAPTFATGWANDDPAAAAAWATSIAEPRKRDEALGRIVSAWATNDPVGASAWLRQWPRDGTRDQLVTTFASQIAESDPETAIEWARSIQADSQRQQIVENVARTWIQTDRDAALQWIRSTPDLSPEQRERLSR
jgi:hypothetical protein